MKNYLAVILLAVLFTMLTGIALAQNVEINDTEANDTEAFQQALEQDGFTVQEGDLAYFDLLKLLEAGVLPSAYGNNPTTKYVIYFVPSCVQFPRQQIEKGNRLDT